METRNGGAYRCVVGIDVAKQAHMVCAVSAPSGQVQLPPTRIPASREGHAQLLTWLGAWAAEPARILVGLESTGALWEPLYEALTRAGYRVLVREPAADRLVGGPRAARGAGARQRAARRDGAVAAHAHARPARSRHQSQRHA